MARWGSEKSWGNGRVNRMINIFFVMNCSRHTLADELTSILIWDGVVKVLYIEAHEQRLTKRQRGKLMKGLIQQWNPSAIISKHITLQCSNSVFPTVALSIPCLSMHFPATLTFELAKSSWAWRSSVRRCVNSSRTNVSLMRIKHLKLNCSYSEQSLQFKQLIYSVVFNIRRLFYSS